MCRWKNRSGGSSATAPSADSATQTKPISDSDTRAPMRQRSPNAAMRASAEPSIIAERTAVSS
jgi:hypothetical protein